MPAFWKAALAAPFLASAPLAPNSTLYSDGIPPIRYQGEKTAVVMFVQQDRIDELCGKAPPGRRTLACSTIINGTPLIVLPIACPDAYTGDFYARLAATRLATRWAGRALMATSLVLFVCWRDAELRCRVATKRLCQLERRVRASNG